jgi:hypothetical protein
MEAKNFASSSDYRSNYEKVIKLGGGGLVKDGMPSNNKFWPCNDWGNKGAFKVDPHDFSIRKSSKIHTIKPNTIGWGHDGLKSKKEPRLEGLL